MNILALLWCFHRFFIYKELLAELVFIVVLGGVKVVDIYFYHCCILGFGFLDLI